LPPRKKPTDFNTFSTSHTLTVVWKWENIDFFRFQNFSKSVSHSFITYLIDKRAAVLHKKIELSLLIKGKSSFGSFFCHTNEGK
jgi:hypothetical protein